MEKAAYLEKLFDQLDDITKIRINLSKESDRGCALLSVSYLDNMLKQCIQNFLVDDKSIVNEILGTGRALGTFSARIDIVYLLGVISLKQRRDLHLIRKIRNDFGHSYDNITFETNPIKNRVQELNFSNLTHKDMRSKFLTETSIHMGTLGRYIHSTSHISKKLDEDNNSDPEFFKQLLNDKNFMELSIDQYLIIKAQTENNNDFIENKYWKELLLESVEMKKILG